MENPVLESMQELVAVPHYDSMPMADFLTTYFYHFIGKREASCINV